MEYKANLAGHHFLFALPCYEGKLTTDTTVGLLDTTAHLTKMGVVHQFNVLNGGSLIDELRNQMVHHFLKSSADILIFIDNDINFMWSEMSRLLAFSCTYPVVSGAYQLKREPAKFVVNPKEKTLNEHGLLPIESLGIGFTAIHRKVFEAIDAESYKDPKTDEIIKAFFRVGVFDGEYVGEDVYFFRSAIKAGFQPMLDPYIALGHVGTKLYNTPFLDALSNIVDGEST